MKNACRDKKPRTEDLVFLKEVEFLMESKLEPTTRFSQGSS